MHMQAADLDLEACLEAVHSLGEAAAGLERDFTRHERACAEAIRPMLGDLYRMARALHGARAAWGVPAAPPPDPAQACLTSREREVLRWLSGGKTDKDIGGILGISPRTVHKHLQRIYEKLGVETRTAAVVRLMQKIP